MNRQATAGTASRPVRRRRRVTAVEQAAQLSLFGPETISGIRAIRALAAAARPSSGWLGEPSCPPDTLLGAVINAFRQWTNISLELPWAMVMIMLSSRLLQNNTRLEVAGTTIECDLWIVLLAASGASKSLVKKLLSEALDIDASFPEVVSAAAWVEALAEQHGTALWIRDEWGQIVREISDPRSPMGQIRDYLLRTYDHDRIERRKVKSEPLIIDHPVMAILGLSVAKTWPRCVTAEMMADGFGQRFSYLLAEPDPTRHFRDYPYAAEDKIRAALRAPAERLMRVPVHSRYTFSDAAVALYERDHHTNAGDEWEEGYFRRIQWRAHQYAAIYHLLLGHTGSVIGVDAMRYATKAIAMHRVAALGVLRLCDKGDYLKIVEKTEAWMRRRKLQGKSTTVRDLVAGVREVKNARMAHDLLKIADSTLPVRD